MEEGNICDFNHLDGDTRLPPRKRLLAGLKKQNSDCASPSSPPLSSIPSSFSTRLQDLINANTKGSELLPEEIVNASRSAALAAAKAAASARARADEKAAVAAKAIAAAKSALDLAASVSEKASRKERFSRKNKMKKHVQVDLLYKKRRLGENCETDEELARKLHRAMNSSPRISKSSVTSESKIHIHYKHKKHLCLKKPRFYTEGEGKSICLSDKFAEKGDLDSGISSVGLVNMNKMDKDDMVFTTVDCSKNSSFSVDRDERVSFLKEKYGNGVDERCNVGRKRGKIKQKKLSLSLCTIRDRENPKEELITRGIPSVEKPSRKCVAENIPVFAPNHSTEDIMLLGNGCH